ncbi:MAG: serine/threonine-protein phosphatase [Chloroflexi bacterium]|nr:serine/threonine-protein phosphatase [Chloroflexota bacterium]
MPSKLEKSVASHDREGENQPYSRYFKAPAAQALGGSVTVAILAESVEGLKGAGEASRIAAETIERIFLSQRTSDIPEAISTAIGKAHQAIIEQQAQNAELAQMGTSVLVAVITGERLIVGGVGDGRVYIVRDNAIRMVASGRTWLREAQENWKLSPGEIREPPPSRTPKEYLGKTGTVKPELLPIEFLWPGDVFLICTSRLAGYLTEEQIRDVLVSQPSPDAAYKLVDLAMQRGGQGNLTAMVGAIPKVVTPFVPAPVKPSAKLTRVVQALVVGNVLLVCLIAVVLLTGDRLRQVLDSANTAQVAMPLVVPTPLPELDVAPSPTASAPAPAPSVTPAPTLAASALSTTWTPPALTIQGPTNGFSFSGPEAVVVLAWESAGNLPEDIYYVVTIRKWINNRLVGESRNWTKSNRIKLDQSFYSAFGDSPGKVEKSAPLRQTPQGRFEWFVTLTRLTGIRPDGMMEGEPVGSPTPVVAFFWGPPLQLAPTRIYGSMNLETDPFFKAERYREASMVGVLSPLSAGLAVISFVLTAIAGWPKMRAKFRERYGRNKSL